MLSRSSIELATQARILTDAVHSKRQIATSKNISSSSSSSMLHRTPHDGRLSAYDREGATRAIAPFAHLVPLSSAL